MNVSIIGTGYVGLVTGVCLADKGHGVVCVDVDQRKVEQINHGTAPFHEPGLSALLRKHLGRRFRATDNLENAVRQSDLTLIAVGTPFRGQRIDLGYVRQAARQIGRALAGKEDYHVVVVKSTVVPGTTDGVVLPVLERASGKRVGAGLGLGMNPEFLSEGDAVNDFMRPDRIVLGGIDPRSLAVMEELYRPFKGVPILRTTTRAAEMIKYASNALLATLISFSNEIGNLCADVGGIDSEEVMRGVHLSHYLTPQTPGRHRVPAPITSFLRAGCGFGGSCLPKDVKALIARGKEMRCPMSLLQEVIRVNEQQPQRLLHLLRRRFADLRGLRVTVLGLAFKPDTDDLRESPAISIIQSLLAAGARVQVYDPVAMPAARRSGLFDGVSYAASLRPAVASAQAVLLVTAWTEFRGLERLAPNRRRSLLVIDGRRLLDKNKFGCYEGIGVSSGA